MTSPENTVVPRRVSFAGRDMVRGGWLRAGYACAVDSVILSTGGVHGGARLARWGTIDGYMPVISGLVR